MGKRGSTARRHVARIGVVFALALVGMAPLHDTATAATGGGSDATGDTAPIADCHADITAFSLDYSETSISALMGMDCGANPNSDPHWTGGGSGALWGIDANQDNNVDFIAGVVNVGTYAGAVIDRSGNALCPATALWDGDKTYGVTFDPSCIGSPPSVRVQAYFEWDETAGSGTCQCPHDLAPDGTTLSGDIARTSPPPPLGYHTACDRTDAAPDAFADAGLAADCLKAWGIALGKNDGTFGEDDTLLRSQVSSLLARLLSTNGIALTARRSFPDVNPDTVPNPQVRDEIEHLAGTGIIAGFPDGTFGPAGTLSDAQAATFVIRTLAVLHGHLGSGPDLHDQGTTTANFDYAVGQGILDPNATDQNGAAYPNASGSPTYRGLLADMLAQSLEKFGKVYYASCAEAQSAGVAPMAQGSSGYRPALDPDGDGTAC